MAKRSSTNGTSKYESSPEAILIDESQKQKGFRPAMEKEDAYMIAPSHAAASGNRTFGLPTSMVAAEGTRRQLEGGGGSLAFSENSAVESGGTKSSCRT